MGYQVQVVPEHRLAVLRLTGAAGAGDVVAAVTRLVGDPRWDPTFDAVWDCRDVGVLDLAPADLQDIAGLLRTVSERRGTGRRALIVRSSLEADLAYLLDWMSKGKVEREIRSFHEARDAAEWLGVPEEVLEYPASLPD